MSVENLKETLKAQLKTSLNPYWYDKLGNFMLAQKDIEYYLQEGEQFFPNLANRFNAINAINPESKVKIVILGQDPYPRIESATGHAFWDGKIKSWENPLSPSFRNLIKSILIHEGLAKKEDKVATLRKLLKENNIFSPDVFFKNSIEQNLVWLNASLTFESKEQKILNKHLKFWTPIIKKIIKTLLENNQYVLFVFWGSKSLALKKYIENTTFNNYFFVENCHPMLEKFHEKNSFEEISTILSCLNQEQISWLKK